MIKKFLALSLCATFLVTTTSCLKKQDLSDDNLGDPIAPLELTKAVGSGFGAFDYNDLKAGETTSLRSWYLIQDSVVQNVSQEDVSVTRAVNTVDALNLDFLDTYKTFNGDQSSQGVTRQYTNVSIDKPSALMTQSKIAAKDFQSLSSEYSPNLMFLNFAYFAFGLCNSTDELQVTCHKLTTTDIQYPVPIAAAAQHNCADANNCTVSAKHVEFDRLLSNVADKDGKPKRVHYTMVLSPNVPFMSRILELCMRGIYSIGSNNQKILVNECYTVNNYKFAP